MTTPFIASATQAKAPLGKLCPKVPVKRPQAAQNARDVSRRAVLAASSQAIRRRRTPAPNNPPMQNNKSKAPAPTAPCNSPQPYPSPPLMPSEPATLSAHPQHVQPVAPETPSRKRPSTPPPAPCRPWAPHAYRSSCSPVWPYPRSLQPINRKPCRKARSATSCRRPRLRF